MKEPDLLFYHHVQLSTLLEDDDKTLYLSSCEALGRVGDPYCVASRNILLT